MLALRWESKSVTLDKIMTGVMGGKTVNIPVQIRQSSERGLRVPRSGQMGNKCVPEGFRHSELQPLGLLWLGDGSKSSADWKQKPILTNSGFTIQTLCAYMDTDEYTHTQKHTDTHTVFSLASVTCGIFWRVYQRFTRKKVSWKKYFVLSVIYNKICIYYFTYIQDLWHVSCCKAESWQNTDALMKYFATSFPQMVAQTLTREVLWVDPGTWWCIIYNIPSGHFTRRVKHDLHMIIWKLELKNAFDNKAVLSGSMCTHAFTPACFCPSVCLSAAGSHQISSGSVWSPGACFPSV